MGNNWGGQLYVSFMDTGIKAIAAGGYHTVGLKEDGTVVAVGDNWFGESYVSSWTGIKAVAAGGYHTVGLKEDGTVVAVGYNVYGQTDVSSWTGVKAIAAGWYHTIGLKEDGTVVAVGNNDSGQLSVCDWSNIKQPGYLEPPTTMDYLTQTTTDINNATFTGSGNQKNALLDKINTALSAMESDPADTSTAISAMKDFYTILCNMKKQGKVDIDTYNTLYNDYSNIMESLGETPESGC